MLSFTAWNMASRFSVGVLPWTLWIELNTKPPLVVEDVDPLADLAVDLLAACRRRSSSACHPAAPERDVAGRTPA